MSSAWKALSATESGCGKNTGSSIVWLRWKGETTLGRNFGLVLRITFSLWTWKKGSSKVRVWSSLTRLREVTATRNNFPWRNWILQEWRAHNGGQRVLVGQRWDFIYGPWVPLGGITLLRPSIKTLMTGTLIMKRVPCSVIKLQLQLNVNKWPCKRDRRVSNETGSKQCFALLIEWLNVFG